MNYPAFKEPRVEETLRGLEDHRGKALDPTPVRERGLSDREAEDLPRAEVLREALREAEGQDVPIDLRRA